ncbi:hypothetical protein [Methylopila sp. M107]|uniref:hypothetical protein n=1 Tax=Methylopila sp. M107 TaxID=1101190 RepID=UPI000377208C|nr:hypothetical protein [Methylopila sp. M107]
MATAQRTAGKTAASGIEVRPLETVRDVDAFWKAELVAQGGDPAFTPRLHKEVKDFMPPLATPFARANDGMSWTAFRDGKPVGRIYAVQHHAHLEKHKDGAGHFGFLEAIDDDAVWDALFDTASDFLRARGLTQIAGPYCASVNHECGLQVFGYGNRSTTHTNYAPPYYAKQLERLGFRGVKDIVGYEGAVPTSRLPQRVARARGRWADGKNLELRPAVGPDALGQMLSIYNDAWADNWGSVPSTMEESKFLAELAADVLPSDWSTLAFWLGEPIGMIVMVPDVNEAVRDLGGRLVPFGWAKLLWRLKVSGVSRARVPLIGVRRAYRGTRVGAMTAAMLLADSLTKAKGAGVERLEVSWMLEENRPIINLVRGMPAQHTKTWRMYSKPL